MTITMYDSVDADDLPPGDAFAGGYDDGRYADIEQIRARFPDATILDIVVTASDDGTCLDVENGDATIDQIPGWLQRQLARGVDRPVIYTSASNVQAVLDVIDGAGIARDRVRIWSAHYQDAHICGPGPDSCGACPAVDGTQWLAGGPGLPQSYDESWLLDTFFPQPTPPEPPAPTPPEDDVKLATWTTGPADIRGVAYTEPIALPVGTHSCVSVVVRVKRRGTPPVGDGPNLVAAPVSDPPDNHCIVRVTGLPHHGVADGTAAFI